MPKDFISPFKDYVCPKPDVKGDWQGRIGSHLPDEPPTASDDLQGHDTVRIEGDAAPGSTAEVPKIPGS
jgi:hypothetical protein